MNLNQTVTKSSKLTPWALVASLFMLLAMSLGILMVVYWTYVLNPRLFIEAESNAKILAESQAKMISTVLSSLHQSITQDDINDLNDQVLVFIDPVLKQPYFLGISLALDDEAMETDVNLLDLSEGDMTCKQCFLIKTALYSTNSDELLGIANFMVSDVFYKKLKNDIKEILLLESLIGLVVLFWVWLAIHFLLWKLNQEILSRKKLTRQLRNAKNNAEKANQTKSEFLANMSHEFRTPLNAIVGLAGILHNTNLNKWQQDLLAKLDSASHLLLNQINDLLDFSKIEAGKLELESISFEMDEVLKSLSALIVNKSNEKNIDVLYRVNRNIPHQLIGDPLRLGQILLNLLDNAFKFTEKGHILLSVEVADLDHCNGNKYISDNKIICLRFSVMDTGIGIKKNDITKLFNSFTQADNSTTRKFGGTGLGLSICKELIKLMDGNIKVVSNFGQGSTFTFYAKFIVGSEDKKNYYTVPDKILDSHVLIIDDNPISQEVFQYMLGFFGFRITVASSAQKGITLVKHHVDSDPIRLILMDWKMSELDGDKATWIIKTQLDLKFTPAIILIAVDTNMANSSQEKIPADDFLVKPVSQSTLYDSIMMIFADAMNISSDSTDVSMGTPLYDLSDKKVLLTEDNITNQEVACALMEEFKLQVSIASNGNEAVNAIKSTNFDLIFMDLQMPEMDGFEAIRHIRLDKDYQFIPIIAMTAHAMEGDRQKCLDAKFDDYISKPIDVDKFNSILIKWLVKKTNHPIVADGFIISENNIHKFHSINIKKALLRVRGNQDLLFRLLINFKNQKSDLAEQISFAISHDDYQLAKDLVHNLKGESGTLEANRLFLAATNLEQLLLDDKQMLTNRYQLSDCVAEVNYSLGEFLYEICDIDRLQQILNIPIKINHVESTFNSEISLDMKNLSLQFQKLAGYLEDNNFRAKELSKEISLVLSASMHSNKWGKVLSLLNELDFKKSLTCLHSLAVDLEIDLI